MADAGLDLIIHSIEREERERKAGVLVLTISASSVARDGLSSTLLSLASGEEEEGRDEGRDTS